MTTATLAGNIFDNPELNPFSLWPEEVQVTESLALCRMHPDPKLEELLDEELLRQTKVIWGVFKDRTCIGALQLQLRNSETIEEETQGALPKLPSTHMYEVQFSLRKEDQGKGFGTLIVKKWMGLREKYPKLSDVFAVIKTTNTASNRLVQKCGFSLHGVYQEPHTLDAFMCGKKFGTKLNIYTVPKARK